MKNLHSAESSIIDHQSHPNLVTPEKNSYQQASSLELLIKDTEQVLVKTDKRAALDDRLARELVYAQNAGLNTKNISAIKNNAVLKSSTSKKHRKVVFNEQMKNVQKELSLSEKIFSQTIHNSLIEKISDFIGSTIARPNALLSGSVTAFIGIGICYVVAHYYGYKMSGLETILAFIIGWSSGMLYDFISYRLRRNR